MIEYENETPKYKKKKDNGSKSNRRSSHKHDYEEVIVQGWLFGFSWAYRCKICGRIKSKSYAMSHEGLRKEVPTKTGCISSRDFLSAEELHEKFPDKDIYIYQTNENGIPSFEDSSLIKLDFPEENSWHRCYIVLNSHY